MRAASQVISVAAPFIWLGMVLAISFLETPLKFRAPGITLALGLGIGRLVFRGLNLVEIGLAVALTVGYASSGLPGRGWAWLGAAWVLLAIQTGVLRPRLDRRAVAIIGGASPPPSRQHLVYIALDGVKVVLLATLGGMLAMEVS